MDCDHQNTIPDADSPSGELESPPSEGEFNALEILARLPDLNQEEPHARAKSVSRHMKRPREVSLRVLGGSVAVLFLLTIVVPYFWGSPESKTSPTEGASAFRSASEKTPSDSTTGTTDLTVTPIADAGSSQDAASSDEALPPEASEFEKALGVVKTDQSSADSTEGSVRPFVVDGATSDTPDRTAHASPSRRPLSPRFEPESVERSAAGNQPWNPEIASPAQPYASSAQPQAEPASQSEFTPWQPEMAAGGTPNLQPSSDPQMQSDTYSPWPAPAHPTVTPATRSPDYTAMNPSASRERTYDAHAPSYQNPPPVWNPYAPPHPQQTPHPHTANPQTYSSQTQGVSPVRPPYQQ